MNARSYLWLAASTTVVFMIGILLLAMEGQRAATALNARIRVIQLRQTRFAAMRDDLTTAETAERGYLLTGDSKYLTEYDSSRNLVDPLLDTVAESFRLDDGKNSAADQSADLRQLRMLMGQKMAEMSASLSQYVQGGPASAVALVQTDISLGTMKRIREILKNMDDRERNAVGKILGQLDRNSTSSFLYLAGVTILMILSIFGATALLDRDMEGKKATAIILERYADDLERQVRIRTAELSALSSHLLDVTEREKATLARELHDELGGLLVAAKMDVSWLEKRVGGSGDPAIQLRWKRVRDALDQGVDLKRRVVEHLRPSLLDTMGLVPALQWVLQETCGRAGLQCTDRYPGQELQLNDDASIKIFRLVQEALTNVVKHARGSEVSLDLSIVGDELVIRIVDNGVGVPAINESQGGFRGLSSGLASMRHRVASVGGRWELNSPAAGGTEILACLPLARILASKPG